DLVVTIAAVLQRLFDCRQIFFGRYLRVQLAVNRQHWHPYLEQRRPWIVTEEKAEPWCQYLIELARRTCQLRFEIFPRSLFDLRTLSIKFLFGNCRVLFIAGNGE